MALDQVLKRHFWAVILGLTGAAAFFDAQGLTQMVGSGLGADEKQLAAPPLVSKVPPAVGSAGSHVTSADAILSRNPFDSVTGPLNKAPVVESDAGVDAGPVDTSDPMNAPVCDGVK